jgi:NAD(P)-dependent dehydrogenase (short-subunit alcohol dehydrogenase family)
VEELLLIDYQGKAVLITGGTCGIGLATALAFGRCGAQCVLTYRWGSADENELLEQFRAAGAPLPLLIQADVSQAEDCRALLRELKERNLVPEAFISNATGAMVVHELADLTERAVLQSVRYGGWPTYEYLLRMHETFGCWPRYVVAMSSDGPDRYTYGYDLVAASKSVLETLCRYLTHRLLNEDVRINVLRSRAVRTEAFEATFGQQLVPLAKRFGYEACFVEPEDVGRAALALCSGMMDGVRGQVIMVDRGGAFLDDLCWMYQRRETLGL